MRSEAPPSALAELVEVRASTTPKDLAWREMDGLKRDSTWASLRDDSLTWARSFRALGVAPADRVLTMLPSGGDSILVWTALATVGAVDVAVNESYHGDWLRHVANVAQASGAVVHERFLRQWQAIAADLRLPWILVVGPGSAEAEAVGRTRILRRPEFLSGTSGDGEHYPAGDGDAAMVLFTSGTTGMSKGVVTPWGYWRHRVRTHNTIPPDFLGAADVIYAMLPVFHLGGREGFYRVASSGGTVCTRERFSAREFLNDVRAGGCTFTFLIGSIAQYLMSTPELDDDAENPLRGVCYAPVGADVDRLKRRFGLEVFTSYGMTECNNPIASRHYTVDATTNDSAGDADPERELRLVGPDGNDVPTGDVGELWVRDDRDRWKMASGYLNNDVATAESWKDGWFRTGDALRRDADGRFYFVDRMKDAIRRRGENISSFEVEFSIGQHREVAEAAVFAVPSALTEDDVMVAVVPRDGCVVDPAELHEFMCERIPAFAVPRYIDIVVALPKTPTARVQKTKLRERGVSALTWDAEAAEPHVRIR